MRVLFIIFFLMAFVSLQALNFQDIFEIEYLISVAKATMLHGKCGNQRLDPTKISLALESLLSLFQF